jgi:hypothetical protein
LAALRLTAKAVSQLVQTEPGFPVDLIGTTELHATFLEESRTSLFLASAALQEIREIDGPFLGFSPGKTTHRDLCQTTVIAKLLHVSSEPKVTSKTITDDSRQQYRRPSPIPQSAICCWQMISAQRAASRHPPAGRQLPVVSAYGERRTVLPLSGVTPDPCLKSGNPSTPPRRDFFIRPIAPPSAVERFG